MRARGKRGFHRRQDHEIAPEQGGPCLEASHSSCQLINLLFAVLLLLFPEGTLDRVFHIFIVKKKKKVNTTLGKPRHPIEKEILFGLIDQEQLKYLVMIAIGLELNLVIGDMNMHF